MEIDSFVPSLLIDKVKLSPRYLGSKYKSKLHDILVKRSEGKCSKYGYIKTGSIVITNISVGLVETHTLHGFINYNVQFKALVCNPTNGSVLKCVIVNSNNFGILCTSGIDYKGTYKAIIDIIVPKNSLNIKSDSSINMNTLKEGDVVNVEIIGKKYEINDDKISAVGRIVDTTLIPEDANLVDVENNEIGDGLVDLEEETYEDDFETFEDDKDDEVSRKVEDEDDDDDDDEDGPVDDNGKGLNSKKKATEDEEEEEEEEVITFVEEDEDDDDVVDDDEEDEEDEDDQS
jgi:DNA-directed RNA polymerase subunit E'/Rpb7